LENTTKREQKRCLLLCMKGLQFVAEFGQGTARLTHSFFFC
jgi:hypothetical protein